MQSRRPWVDDGANKGSEGLRGDTPRPNKTSEISKQRRPAPLGKRHTQLHPLELSKQISPHQKDTKSLRKERDGGRAHKEGPAGTAEHTVGCARKQRASMLERGQEPVPAGEEGAQTKR
ncbi:hypothetical protein NDU88_007202 [Pleurodeles waltl]|uniref:Uncharacterized protein n=1 Tax=Pleurodeles waltl TaxID=8319 RepID=A0AAV7NSF4_PLEWA|nr:hypothetical protein NDU88_007202 [Pleurodeles waltl]